MIPGRRGGPAARPTRRRPAARRVVAGSALALACFANPLAASALAQTSSTLTLQRSDATIQLVNTGRADQGARTLLNVGGCGPEGDARTSVFYAPEGGVTASIVPTDGDEDTVVHAPLMTVLEPEATTEPAGGGGDPAPPEADGGGEGGTREDMQDAIQDAVQDDTAGGGEGGDEATLEALDATATFPGRPPCPEVADAAADPGVRLVQGRTSVVGGRFFLDRESDVATMDGPVALTRAPDGDGPTVEAQAEALRFDLEADRSTLTGDVTVQAGDRVSEADELELDEGAGLAILRGSPAVSREGGDVVRGDRLLYDLETNDVTVEGGVSATFERD